MCINTTQELAQFTQGNEKLHLNSQQFQFAPNSQHRFHQASERLLQNSSKSRKDEADERKHVPDSHRGFADQSCAPHGARGSDCNVMSTALTMKLMSGLPWQLSSGARAKSSQPCTHCILTEGPEGTWGEQECSWTARFGHLQHLVTAPVFGQEKENENKEPNSNKILIQAALICANVPANDLSDQVKTAACDMS